MPTLTDIAALIGSSPPPGEPAPMNITGMAVLAEAGPTELSFVGSDAYLNDLAASRAGAVIAQRRVKLPATWTRPTLVVDDADLAVAKVLALFAPPAPRPPVGVDALARVAPTATLGEGVAIAPFVFVGQRVRLGARCVLHPGVYIGDDATLGDDCELFPNVTVRERIVIGHRVVIHANSVLGTDGFGYRWDGRGHQKVPHIGTVIVEDDVEIGSCSCVDRAKFSVTRVGRGTKIDNLVQIGHNAITGPHCILVGQSGLAGSVKLGAGVVVGGQAAIRDHVTVGDGAMVAGTSGVADDVPAKAVVSGIPALPHRQTFREQAALRRLPDLVVQVRKLAERVDPTKNG